MCHKDLGVPLVCEGVETAAERDVLLRERADFFQGYLFAKPGRPPPVARWSSMTRPRSAQESFARTGDMGTLIRELDWSKTPLRLTSEWPQSLRTSVSICLNSRFPTVIYWGPQFATIYNDGYAPILGIKHPWALGRPAHEVWSEIWSVIEPMMNGVVSTGVATWSEDQLLNLNRKGYVEECYFTFSFAPVTIESGETGGIFTCVAETTERVIGERRLRTLRELGEGVAGSSTVEDACNAATRVLCGNVRDVPFTLIYLLDADGKQARLASTSGIEPGRAASPAMIGLEDDRADWPLARVARTGAEEIVLELPKHFGEISGGSFPESIRTAVVLPIARPGQDRPYGLLVAGVSPRRALDDSYRTFFKLVAGQIATALTSARAYQEERNRAEALLEIDRAKTAFFSNVSHEFRTPLTLMLGPVEDALASPAQTLAGESLEAVHRNSLQLLRLVNTLLDFSRIEAGRAQASFEPTDLAELTTSLASAFRSVVERAGLRFEVDCPPLPEPIYVDRDMWEKIVLNLISNAFKFTFEGTITVCLRWLDAHVELAVRDTGTGVPENELPHLFDRFHRVQGARSRTHEGTGIGLALVRELVKLHGGTVDVGSQIDEGTTFTVAIRRGFAHLPQERLGTSARSLSSTRMGALPFVEAALGWSADGGPDLAQASTVAHVPTADTRPRARVLIADDNADLRDYVTRLLAPQYLVEAVGDGVAALEAARDHTPDLVLSDVMMPRLDGLGLLRELRADERTRAVPIILLSARAGEESTVVGLAAGADDYLAKPFSARELLARVRTHLELARKRREWAGELERANAELDAFSYSVSHDLRAPLRAIDGFSRALLDEYREKFDEQGRHYLERVRSGTQRMSALIDDLLDLSRITRAPLQREPINLTEIARGIVAELHRREPSRTVQVEVADGLDVKADARLTTVALENLIGNSWKFTSRRPEGRITIGKQENGGEIIFHVRDNGAGFDMVYADKLFAPFQRLHKASDFEGTGIGLATVHRVVSRHGGRIWAEAAVDRGATFYFTLGESP